jgi:flagellar protein FliO/FliZ
MASFHHFRPLILISSQRFFGVFPHSFLLLVPATSPLVALAETAPQATQGVSSGTVLQAVLGLALILGLLFLATYLLRRLNGGRGFGTNGPLRIVGGLMISTRERIVLLEVGDVWLLVGIGPGQIRTLHTMPKGQIQASSTVEQPFGQWLKQMIEQKNEHK